MMNWNCSTWLPSRQKTGATESVRELTLPAIAFQVMNESNFFREDCSPGYPAALSKGAQRWLMKASQPYCFEVVTPTADSCLHAGL